jgi:hypothetical protein
MREELKSLASVALILGMTLLFMAFFLSFF